MTHPLSPDDAIRKYVIEQVTETMGAKYAKAWRNAAIIRTPEDAQRQDRFEAGTGIKEPRIVVYPSTETPERPSNWMRNTAVVFPHLVGRTSKLHPGPTSPTEPDLPEGSPLYELEYALPCDLCGRKHVHGWPGPLPEPGAVMGMWSRHCGESHRPFRDDCQAYRGRGEDSRCHVDHGAASQYPGMVSLVMPSRITDEDREAAARLAEKRDAWEAEFQQTAAALYVALDRPATVVEVYETMIRVSNARKAAEAVSTAEAV